MSSFSLINQATAQATTDGGYVAISNQYPKFAAQRGQGSRADDILVHDSVSYLLNPNMLLDATIPETTWISAEG